MFRIRYIKLLKYGFAVLAVALAFLLGPLFYPVAGAQSPFLLFLAAVLGGAWYGGFGPGVLATFLATAICSYFYLPPTHILAGHTLDQNLRLGLFAIEGVLISLLGAALHTLQKKAEAEQVKVSRYQKSLNQSEERYRLLIDNVKDYAVCMLDPKGNVVSWNLGAERILGYSEKEVIGQHFSKFFLPEEIEAGEPEKEASGAIADGKAEDERWHVRKDGSRFWASGVLTSLWDEKGDLLGFYKIFRDLTDRKQAEIVMQQAHDELEWRVQERTAELSEVNTSLREQINDRLRTEAWLRDDAERLAAVIATQYDIAIADMDLLRVMNLIVERTQKLARANGVAIALANGNQMVFRIASGTIAPHIGLRFEVDSSLAGLCFRTGEVLLCNDTETDPRVNLGVCRQVEGRSIIVVPLRYERRIIGVLKVASQQVNAFDQRVVHTLELMAGFIAAAMIHAAEFEARQAMVAEHAVALEALRESEERFRSAFNSSAVGMALLATDGRFLQVNQSLCEMLGYSEQALLAINSQSITHPDDLDIDLTFMSQMLTGEVRRYQLEKRYVHKQGHHIWALLNVSLVHDPRGNSLHFIAQIQDVTERKQAEEERAQLIREQAARAIAEEAERRSAFLAGASTLLATSLEYETTLSSIALLAVPFLADWCIVDVVEENGSIRRLTVTHADPGKANLVHELQNSYPPVRDTPEGVAKVLRTAETWYLPEVSDEDIARVAQDERHLQLLRELGIESIICVPLCAQGRVLGAVSFICDGSKRTYVREDVTLAEELASRAAIAMENASLYQQAQQARHAAEQAADRTTRLQAVTAALSEALTPTQVAGVVVEQGVAALNANAGAIALLTENGTAFRLLRASGLPEEIVEKWQHFPVTAPIPFADVVQTGEPLLVASRDEWATRYPSFIKELNISRDQALVAIPLIVEGHTLGVMGLSFHESQTFSNNDSAFILALGQQCAQALERARLYDAEQTARTEAEAAQDQSAFLAEASKVLASSLDYETTLAAVTRLAVPKLADCCMVSINENGVTRRVASAHADPIKEELLKELQCYYPFNQYGIDPIVRVIQTSNPEIVSEIPDRYLEYVVQNTEHLEMIRKLGLKSYMIVPLVAHGRTLGAISFIGTEEIGRCYDHSDLIFAEELARRVALAVDNARLYREAQEVNRMKDEFLATLSHELRTPLNSMLGWSRLLRTRKFDEATVERALETIERNAKVQAQLTEDILEVSRIIQGKLQLNVRPTNLPLIIDAAVDAIRPAADAKAILVECFLDPSVGLISGDPDRLQQVVWNLVSNAIKFTSNGGRVAVYLSREDTSIQIKVVDTGQGINSDFLPYVFDRFRQADSSITRPHGGLGLGLAIVRHLVELHGGTVSAESRGENMGATFTVNLPLMLSSREKSSSEQEQESQDDPTSMEDLPTLDGLYVLVVDDEADARELLTTVLEFQGARVTAVASVEEAIAALQRTRPDVLVSDIGMPEEDGYALIRQVRALEVAHEKMIPAVALTAYAREEDKNQVLSAGFQKHIAKPVEPAELTSVVASLAGRSERLDQGVTRQS